MVVEGTVAGSEELEGKLVEIGRDSVDWVVELVEN